MKRSVLMVLLVLGLVVALTESAPNIRAKRGEDDSDESEETENDDPLDPVPLGPGPRDPGPRRPGPRRPAPRRPGPRRPGPRRPGPRGSADPSGRAEIEDELRALEEQAIIEQRQRQAGNQGDPPLAVP